MVLEVELGVMSWKAQKKKQAWLQLIASSILCSRTALQGSGRSLIIFIF